MRANFSKAQRQAMWRDPIYMGGKCACCKKRPRDCLHAEYPSMCDKCRESRTGLAVSREMELEAIAAMPRIRRKMKESQRQYELDQAAQRGEAERWIDEVDLPEHIREAVAPPAEQRPKLQLSDILAQLNVDASKSSSVGTSPVETTGEDENPCAIQAPQPFTPKLRRTLAEIQADEQARLVALEASEAPEREKLRQMEGKLQ